MSIQLEKDRDGNVITNPVTAWGVTPVAELVVLLAIQYAQTPEELETGRTRQIQFVLKPQACLQLAEELNQHGKNLLKSHPPTGKPLN